MSNEKDNRTAAARADSPAPTGYATAVWVLTCAAEEREKAASKLREWTEEERSPGLAAAIPQLEREAKELRAAAHALESHTKD